MNENADLQEAVIPQVFEEVSWEVFSQASESEISEQSEESDYEDSGNEICYGRHRKRYSVS